MLSLIIRSSHKLSLSAMKPEIRKMIALLEKQFKQKAKRVAFAFVTKDEIAQMNKQYLGKEGATDVLSFPENSGGNVEGDIAVCLDAVLANAEEDKEPAEVYTAEAILHGLLHLFGFEHDYSKESLENVYRVHAELFEELKPDWRKFYVQKNQQSVH